MPRGRVVYRGPNVTVWYDFHPRGIARAAMGHELRAAVHHVAEHVAKPYAISISPHYSGRYKRAFKVHDTTRTIDGPAGALTRVAADLVNNAHLPSHQFSYATVVELGHRPEADTGLAPNRTPAYRVMGRTLAWLHATAATRR